MMIHYIDPIDSIISALAAPYERLADSLAIVTSVQSKLMHKTRFDWTPIAILVTLLGFYLTHYFAEKREKKAKYKSNLLIWKLCDSIINQNLVELKSSILVMNVLKGQLGTIDNLILETTKISSDFKRVTELDTKDLFSAFIELRVNKSKEQIPSFSTILRCIKNIDDIIDWYNKSIQEFELKKDKIINDINELNQSVSEKEKEIGNQILNLFKNLLIPELENRKETTELANKLQTKYSQYLDKYYKGEFYDHIAIMALIVGKEFEVKTKTEFIDELPFEERMSFKSVYSELKRLNNKIIELKSLYQGQIYFIDQHRDKLETSIDIVRVEMKLFDISKNPFIDLIEV